MSADRSRQWGACYGVLMRHGFKIKRHLWAVAQDRTRFFPCIWPTVLLVLSLVVPYRAAGQLHPDSDHRGQWCAGVGGGFLIPHRAAMRAMIDGHAQRVDLTWSQLARGIWSHHRKGPAWGLSLHWASTGADEHVGRQAAALAFSDLALRGRLHVRIGGGLGWSEKPWEEDGADARERIVIGSHINGAAQIGLHLLPDFRHAHGYDRIGLHLRLDHQSNASYSQPNLGTNLLTAGLSAVIGRSGPRPAADTSMTIWSVLPAPVKGRLLYVGWGRRQPAPLQERESVMEWGVDHRFKGRSTWSWVAGGMAFMRPGHPGAALHAGFQLTFTRVQLDFLHGRYLWRWQPEESGYNRVVLNVHLKQGWWSRIALHTHGFRAHHPAVGLAWVPGNRSPLAPLR